MEYLIKAENGVVLGAEISNRIASIELLKKQIKEEEEEVKKSLLEAMESHNVIKIENEDLIINYVAGTDREYFDKNSLRKDYPHLYDDYVTMKPVKPSLRIKLK